MSILSIAKFIRRSELFQEEDGCKIIVTERDIDPFSWRRFIVLSRKDWEGEHASFIVHEKAHIRYGHSVELLLVDGGNYADDTFRHEALYRAIRRLPEKERAALLLFYMDDRPVKKNAAILDIPASSVRAYLTRGRQHIKTILEKWKKR